MSRFTVLDAQEVTSLLDYDGCIAAVGEAMARFSADGIAQPLRSMFRVAQGKTVALMPGALSAPEGMGAKLITVYHDPHRAGRSAHRGVVVLFDRDTGEVACVADAGAITHIRTAAASAVATNALARADARVLGVYGCGAQAASHIAALPRVRSFQKILVWGRDPGRAAAFAAQMAETTGLAISSVSRAEDVASASDVICTVTSSATPILRGAWVRPGTHINVVGSSFAGPVEIDSDLVAAGRFIVDSRASALTAAAEFLIAKEAGLIDDAHIVAEIGEVLLGRVTGRTAPHEITIYKSLGHVVQDLAATAYVHAKVAQRP
jgi:ornithine cyclodeaminase